MNDVELLEQANDNIKMVFEKMTLIESLNELKKSVSDGKIGVMMPDNSMLSLDMLSQEQINRTKDLIFELIEDNMTDARKFLSRFNLLTHKPSIINQDFEDAVQEMVNQKEETPTIPIDDTEEWKREDVLRKLFIDKGMTAKAIGEMYGVTKCAVGNQLKKYGIRKDNFVPGRQDYSKKKVNP